MGNRTGYHIADQYGTSANRRISKPAHAQHLSATLQGFLNKPITEAGCACGCSACVVAGCWDEREYVTALYHEERRRPLRQKWLFWP